MSPLRDLLLLPSIWRRLVEEERQRRLEAEVRPTVERIVRHYREDRAGRVSPDPEGSSSSIRPTEAA